MYNSLINGRVCCRLFRFLTLIVLLFHFPAGTLRLREFLYRATGVWRFDQRKSDASVYLSMAF